MATSDYGVAAVLVREERSIQRPVYYVSKALSEVEARYFNAEKLAYALVIAARKLRAYFVAHTIVVLTDAPLRKILQQPDTAERLLKWSIELTEFDIRYESRRAIKAQALVDFIVETSFTKSQAELVEEGVKKRATKRTFPSLIEEKERPPDCWSLHVDGSSAKDKGGAGITLASPDEECKYEKALRFKFAVSNNQAEYEALVAGIELARDIGLKKIIIHSDSQLIVNQVKGEYDVLHPVLVKYCNLAKNILKRI